MQKLSLSLSDRAPATVLRIFSSVSASKVVLSAAHVPATVPCVLWGANRAFNI